MPVAVSIDFETPRNGQVPKNCAKMTLLKMAEVINIDIKADVIIY